MRNRLFLRILFAFGLIILLGALVNIGYVSIASRQAYRRLVRQEDRRLAEELAPGIADYYRRTGSLDGVQSLFAAPPAFDQMPMHRRGEDMMPRMPRMRLPSIVVTDPRGQIRSDSAGLLARGSRLDPDEASAVRVAVGERTVGWIYVGSMILTGAADEGQALFRMVLRSAAFASGTVVILALLLGILLARSISRPIAALADAAGAVSRGDFTRRISLERKDELGSLIKEFNRMVESLGESEAWKRRLIRDTAHELRTPVAVIQGELEMIMEGVYMPDAERIAAIHRETQLLTRLIGDMGELASAEAGEMRLRRERFDLAELVAETVAAFETQAAAAGVRLRSELAPGLWIEGDRQKLAQVFRNLIGNAIQQLSPGDRVDIYQKEGRELLRLGVDDSGPGIPPEFREKVFERFFRLDSARSRDTGGAGIGLSIARQIMRLHKGDLIVEQGRNGGALFLLLLPRLDRQALE